MRSNRSSSRQRGHAPVKPGPQYIPVVEFYCEVEPYSPETLDRVVRGFGFDPDKQGIILNVHHMAEGPEHRCRYCNEAVPLDSHGDHSHA